MRVRCIVVCWTHGAAVPATALGACCGHGSQARCPWEPAFEWWLPSSTRPGVFPGKGRAHCISALQVNFKPTEDLESLLQALLPSMSGLLQLGLTGRIGGEHRLLLTWGSVCCQAQGPTTMCCSYCLRSMCEAGAVLRSWPPVSAHVCTCPPLPT